MDTACLDSKVDETNMGPIWGREDPGGPHVGPMNRYLGVYPKKHIFKHILHYYTITR